MTPNKSVKREQIGDMPVSAQPTKVSIVAMRSAKAKQQPSTALTLNRDSDQVEPSYFGEK